MIKFGLMKISIYSDCSATLFEKEWAGLSGKGGGAGVSSMGANDSKILRAASSFEESAIPVRAPLEDAARGQLDYAYTHSHSWGLPKVNAQTYLNWRRGKTV